MAVASIPVLVLSVTATGTITQYAAITGAGVIATAAGRAAGFAKTAGVSGDRVPFDAEGTAIAVAGGAIAVDAALEVGSSGAVVTKSSGVVVARALTAAAQAGDLIEVQVIQN